MKKVELIEAEIYKLDGEEYVRPKGEIMKGIETGRNRILRKGKVIRIDVKLIKLGGQYMFKVTEYSR